MTRGVAVRIIPRMTRALAAATVLLCLPVLGACGEDSSPTPVTGAKCEDVYYEGERTPDVIIVSDFPRRGPRRRPVTTRMVEAIQLALRNRDFRAGDLRVGYQSCDDAVGDDFDAATCAANAEAYVANEDVIGVIGPYNSGCATEMLPIIGRRSAGPLAMVSPSNTYLGLTRAGTGVCCGHPDALYPDGLRSYARVVPPDDEQGAAGAVVVHDRGARRAVVLVQREESYAVALAAYFARAARALGVRVATIDYRALPSFAALARTVRAQQPDAVYVAGLANANGRRLIEDLRATLGKGVPLVTADAWILVAGAIGPAGDGMLVTHAGLPVEQLPPAGERFIEQFAQPAVELQDKWVPESGQATEVLLDAIARSDGTRASVVEEVKRTNVRNGILGSFRFDASGDIDPALFSLYRFRAGRTELVGTIAVPGALSR